METIKRKRSNQAAFTFAQAVHCALLHCCCCALQYIKIVHKYKYKYKY